MSLMGSIPPEKSQVAICFLRITGTDPFPEAIELNNESTITELPP